MPFFSATGNSRSQPPGSAAIGVYEITLRWPGPFGGMGAPVPRSSICSAVIVKSDTVLGSAMMPPIVAGSNASAG